MSLSPRQHDSDTGKSWEIEVWNLYVSASNACAGRRSRSGSGSRSWSGSGSRSRAAGAAISLSSRLGLQDHPAPPRLYRRPDPQSRRGKVSLLALIRWVPSLLAAPSPPGRCLRPGAARRGAGGGEVAAAAAELSLPVAMGPARRRPRGRRSACRRGTAPRRAAAAGHRLAREGASPRRLPSWSRRLAESAGRFSGGARWMLEPLCSSLPEIQWPKLLQQCPRPRFSALVVPSREEMVFKRLWQVMPYPWADDGRR